MKFILGKRLIVAFHSNNTWHFLADFRPSPSTKWQLVILSHNITCPLMHSLFKAFCWNVLLKMFFKCHLTLWLTLWVSSIFWLAPQRLFNSTRLTQPLIFLVSHFEQRLLFCPKDTLHTLQIKTFFQVSNFPFMFSLFYCGRNRKAT